MTLPSGANIALWFVLYWEFYDQAMTSPHGAPVMQLMMFLSAAYVFGCAFRSVLPLTIM